MVKFVRLLFCKGFVFSICISCAFAQYLHTKTNNLGGDAKSVEIWYVNLDDIWCDEEKEIIHTFTVACTIINFIMYVG